MVTPNYFLIGLKIFLEWEITYKNLKHISGMVLQKGKTLVKLEKKTIIDYKEKPLSKIISHFAGAGNESKVRFYKNLKFIGFPTLPDKLQGNFLRITDLRYSKYNIKMGQKAPLPKLDIYLSPPRFLFWSNISARKSAVPPVPLTIINGILGDSHKPFHTISADDNPPQIRSIIIGALTGWDSEKNNNIMYNNKH